MSFMSEFLYATLNVQENIGGGGELEKYVSDLIFLLVLFNQQPTFAQASLWVSD